jgi:hypothetical protein
MLLFRGSGFSKLSAWLLFERVVSVIPSRIAFMSISPAKFFSLEPQDVHQDEFRLAQFGIPGDARIVARRGGAASGGASTPGTRVGRLYLDLRSVYPCRI